jgi:hypothetical protein
MTQRDGSILRVIGDQHGAWTNGDVINPQPPANELLALGGNPNIWTLTIEGEGGPDDVMPKEQFDATVWQVETWIIQYPHILDHLWSILRHRHINSKTRYNCSDRGNTIPSIRHQPVIDAVNTWLATAVNQEPEPEPEPLYPAGMTPELARALYGSITKRWRSEPFEFEEKRSECQYWLAQIRAQLKPGEPYTNAEFGPIVNVIRRGKSKNIHVYQWAGMKPYEKVIRGI